MFFLVMIFNMLFMLFSCDAFNSGLFACRLALNPFSTFQPSKISQGDIEKIGDVRELNYGSQSEVLQFLKQLKYAKLVGGAVITVGGVMVGRYSNGAFLLSIPFMALPTAAYVSQLNQFEKDMKEETKYLRTKAYYRP